VSVQASYLPPGAGYWPIGDIYPLTPQWAELHTSQGILPVDEAPLVHNHIIPYGFDWSVTVELTDLGTLLNTYPSWYPNAAAFAAAAAVDDTTPTGYVRTESVISKSWGWSNYYSFVVTQLLDTNSAWNGQLKLTVPVSLQDKLGFGEAWSFRVRVILNDGVADYPVYVMLGNLAVRP